jgi:hypothetical protein
VIETVIRAATFEECGQTSWQFVFCHDTPICFSSSRFGNGEGTLYELIR